MGFVANIDKKHELDKAVVFVRDKMIPNYAKYFGLPAWLEKPKTDQNPEAIIRQYAIKLEPYEETVVLAKGEILFREKNLRTFPSPEQIAALLSRFDLKVIETADKQAAVFTCLESEYMQANKNSKLYSHILFNDYTRAIKYVINELLPDKIGQYEYEKIRNKGYAYLVALAKRNGLFDNFDNILQNVYDRYHGTNCFPQEFLAL